MAPSLISLFRHFLLGKPSKEPPPFLTLRSSTGFITFTICLAIFTDIFLYGLVVPVIPFSLTVQVGADKSSVQEWTAILLACYSGALFVGAPIAGFYTDRTHSRRLPLLIGLLALAAATLLLCLGTTIILLIVGRILQGLSAAVVWSVGCALLVDTVGVKGIGVAMGWVGIAMSVGLLVAPVIGGAVYDAAGYYAVYYVAFAIIFLDIVLRLFLIEKKFARQWTGEEPASAPGVSGLAAAENGSSTNLPGPDFKPQREPAAMEIAGLDLDTVVGLPLPGSTASVSDKAPALLPPQRVHPTIALIKSKRVVAAIYGMAVQAGLMMAYDTTLPLFVQFTFKWDSTTAGLSFLCLFLPGFIAPAVGYLSDRYGPTWPSFLGFIISIPLLVCMRFVTENTVGHKVLFGALLVLIGITLAFVYTPLMAEVSYIIEDKEAESPGIFGERGVYGLAYGLFTTFWALGGTVGSLVSGYLVERTCWGTMMLVLGAWAATGALFVGLWVGGGLGRALFNRRKSSDR